VASELCRSLAHEAHRRGARVNVHELWALLERVDDLHPRVIVDIDSGPGVLWAWWALGARVIGAGSPGDSSFRDGRLPEVVTRLDGDPGDMSTARRVADQLAGDQADVLVIGNPASGEAAETAYRLYSPLVRNRGLVVVHGIESGRMSGVRQFWQSLEAGDELIGGESPIGYGVVEIHGKDRASHG
jgi:hypothetical protein